MIFCVGQISSILLRVCSTNEVIIGNVAGIGWFSVGTVSECRYKQCAYEQIIQV